MTSFCDCRGNSVDSDSNYGPVSKGLIFGKATHIIWPPERWGRLESAIPDIGPLRRVESRGQGRVKIVNQSEKDLDDWI